MSDEREVKGGQTANDEVKPDDVEAHVKTKRNDEGTEQPDDDVEAHVKTK